MSLVFPASAGTYFVENPSLICAAHFKSGFAAFFESNGDGFVFEFEEKAHQTKDRWGYRYNGGLVGEDTSMLLNWPDDYTSGVITILDLEYPCRAFYSTDKSQEVQAVADVEAPVPEVEAPVKKTGLVVAELKAMVTNDEAAEPEAVETAALAAATSAPVRPPSQQVSPSPAAAPAVVPQVPSSQSAAPAVTMASAPTISITGMSASGPQGMVTGRVADQTGVAQLLVDGRVVPVDGNGNFTATAFVPLGGTQLTLTVFNAAGLSTTTSIRLDRSAGLDTALSFEELNPIKRKAEMNENALALIIGVANYASAAAPAIYADTDAQVFHDYATEKLGVPANRIKMLVNDAADERGMLLAGKRWLTRASSSGQSDIYIFFAGHGLASDDGQNMYLLPYDGAPELLDDTAILRDRLFQDLAAVNPRSVTVFLDTCYSGATRGSEMLIASRPIAIRARQQSIPEGFTLMTAAAGDETAKPLEEVKHGMFSYFLMKGMEGDADSNGDNQITTGELHAYVQQNVIQQSSGSQTPELQGDADRVLVRFQ